MKMPFIATIVFHRGKFCEHSEIRQCDQCFINCMHEYNSVIEIDDMIKQYLVDHKLKTIQLVESFTARV